LTVAVVVELLHAFALTSRALDSKSNWLEDAMLCGVYAFAALVFFFSP
jgi:Ca2+/H+ antiporter